MLLPTGFQSVLYPKVSSIPAQDISVLSAGPPHNSHPDLPRRPAASPLGVLGLQQTQVGFPFVADNLPAGEAAYRDDHGGVWRAGCRQRYFKARPGASTARGSLRPSSAPRDPEPRPASPRTLPRPRPRSRDHPAAAAFSARAHPGLLEPACPRQHPGSPLPPWWYIPALRCPSEAERFAAPAVRVSRVRLTDSCFAERRRAQVRRVRGLGSRRPDRIQTRAKKWQQVVWRGQDCRECTVKAVFPPPGPDSEGSRSAALTRGAQPESEPWSLGRPLPSAAAEPSAIRCPESRRCSPALSSPLLP